MKFNKKVYVIPQEKYHSLLENHKKYTTDEPGRLAAAAAAGQVPSFRVPGEVQAGPSSSAGGGHLEIRGAPVLNGNTMKRGRSTSKDRLQGRTGLRTGVIMSEIESRLRDQSLVNKSRAILYLLSGEGEGDYESYYVDLLLHTQSSSFPVPTGHHKLYWLMLQRGVPLNLISNVKLRRILHYMKNKYEAETKTETETEEEQEEG
jgi:hypothetical protein